MMDHLTVAQNIFIGRESTKKNGLFLDEKLQNKRAEELFKRLNMNIDPKETLGNLTVGKQQMVEIAKGGLPQSEDTDTGRADCSVNRNRD